MIPELLTFAEAMKALKMSERQLRKLVAARKIEVVREGRWVRFEPAAIAAYVADRRVPVLRVVDAPRPLPPEQEELEEIARRCEAS